MTDNNLSAVKQALLALQAAQKKIDSLEKQKSEPIAIVGMACRFPGNIQSPDDFWNLLISGKETVTEIPESRWNSQRYYSADYDEDGKIITTHGSFFSNVQDSDPAFFDISPREAKSMDPQQHLLLEVCWESLEHANIVPSSLAGSKTGIFIGICNQDYSHLSMGRDKKSIDSYMTTGMAHSVASGRLSYTLGLEGPCIAIDTACSSSLVAVHLACQSLRNQECDLAITGGVNLTLSPETSIDFSRNRMLSPDGKCKAFSAEANGFGRGEGCGLIVLKRLSDVDEKQDRVLAIIRGSAVNQDGASSGLTAPNGPSQQRVIRDALKNAQLQPEKIDYIEAHGTGTNLGDPIEIGALAEVFSSTRTPDHPLYIGSVKTNVGHMEGAAGISGLMKVVLALQNKVLPAHLHCQKQNPKIAWDQLPFQITHAQKDWVVQDKTRMAGVSSFGFSGTNSHVILEEAPSSAHEIQHANTSLLHHYHALNISARSQQALKAQAKQFIDRIQILSEDQLTDFCFAASTNRTHFENRLSIIGQNKEALIAKLNAFINNQPANQIFESKLSLNTQAPKVAWVFTGQGSQYPGMGKELFETEPVFKDALLKCATVLDPIINRSLVDLILGHHPDDLNQTLYTQPALFSLEYSLAQLWLSWGIKPDAVAGHSVGEYAAACIAGVFSLEDGLKLIATRARLMHELKETGGMAAVFASENEIRSIFKELSSDDVLDIAGINTPKETVVSGKISAIKNLLTILDQKGIQYRELTVSHAFHSALMEPMLNAFQNFAQSISYKPANIPLLSNLTGDIAGEELMTPAYWRNHIRQPVQFSKIAQHFIDEQFDILMEIGPQPILLGMIGQNEKAQNIKLLPSLRKNKTASESILESLSGLHLAGLPIDWQKVYSKTSAKFIDLPTYPFQRQRHWINARTTTEAENNTPSFDMLDLIKEGNLQKMNDHLKSKIRLDDKDNELANKICQALIDEYQSSQHQNEQNFYNPVWLKTSDLIPLKNATGPSHRHLIFAPNIDLVPEQALNGSESSNIYVMLGQTYDKKSDSLWIINENVANDYTRVIKEISNATEISSICLMWSDWWNENNFQPTFGEQILLNAMQVSKALTHLQINLPVWFLVKTAAEVNINQFSLPFSSLLNGFGRSLFLENPAIKGGIIEYNDAGAEFVFHEITSDAKEDHIRLIGNKKYVSRLERADTTLPSLFKLAQDAAYVITGGAGSLGLQTARFLASKGAHELILLGRTTPNEQAQRAIQEIEALGTQVLFMPCDLAQPKQVKQVFDYLKKNKRKVKGIVHAAGIATPALCRDMDPETLHRMFESKVQGAWNLHEQTKALDLDFFVLYSSISSLIGSAELAHYSAANAFMDGLSNYRRSLNLPSVSINWGPWDSGGMVQNTAGSNKVFSSGFSTLKPAEALAYLEQALALNHSQIAIVKADWDKLKDVYAARSEQHVFDLLTADRDEDRGADIPVLLQSLQEMPAWNRSDTLTEFLTQQVCLLLEIADSSTLDPKRGFFDFGMGSLMAVELRSRLEKQLACKLPPSTIFDFPSIEQLSKYLLSLLFEESKAANESKTLEQGANLDQTIPDVHAGATLTDSEIAALIDGELSSLIAQKDKK